VFRHKLAHRLQSLVLTEGSDRAGGLDITPLQLTADALLSCIADVSLTRQP